MPVVASLTSRSSVLLKYRAICAISPTGAVKGQSSRVEPEASERSYVTMQLEKSEVPSVAPAASRKTTEVKVIFALRGLTRYSDCATRDAGWMLALIGAEALLLAPSRKRMVPATRGRGASLEQAERARRASSIARLARDDVALSEARILFGD